MGDPVIRDYLRGSPGPPNWWIGLHRGHDPGRALLLEGRNATTHWSYHRLLERMGATYLPERWVEDGKVITSAGVSAGIDLALALVAWLTDEPTARMVQLWIEYDPIPLRRDRLDPGGPGHGRAGRPSGSRRSWPTGRTLAKLRVEPYNNPYDPAAAWVGSTGAGLPDLREEATTAARVSR